MKFLKEIFDQAMMYIVICMAITLFIIVSTFIWAIFDAISFSVIVPILGLLIVGGWILNKVLRPFVRMLAEYYDV